MSLQTKSAPGQTPGMARTTRPLEHTPATDLPAPRRIAVLAFPEAQSLDVIGPIEVFASSSHWLASERGAPGYEIELFSSTGAGALRALVRRAAARERAAGAARGPGSTR